MLGGIRNDRKQVSREHLWDWEWIEEEVWYVYGKLLRDEKQSRVVWKTGKNWKRRGPGHIVAVVCRKETASTNRRECAKSALQLTQSTYH